MSEDDAEFFLQLAANRLFWALTVFNTAAGRAVKDRAAKWVDDFGDQEFIVVPDHAKRGLSDFDIHHSSGVSATDQRSAPL